MTIEIRLLTTDDDLGADLDLTRRAFGPGNDDRRLAQVRQAVEAGRYLAAFDGTALVASARYLDLRQWWRGRPLRTAGIAAVKVAPEERGRGVGRALMAGLLELAAGRGYPLSVLYPATAGLYRAVGFELAGGQYEVKVPARSLRALQPPDPAAGLPAAGVAGAAERAGLRRAVPADAAELTKVNEDLHVVARDCGPVTHPEQALASLIDDEDIYCYLAPDGLLIYEWNRPQDELLVYCLLAGSAATARALWSVVGSHGTMVAQVRAFVSPADPVSWLVSEPDVVLSRPERWMLRLLDAPAAIAGRGYPAGASLAVPLVLTDDLRPAGSGSWLLEIAAGQGALTRAVTDPCPPATPAGPLRLGARGLAALYAGTPLRTLRTAGLAAGGDEAADEALDEAFGCTAFMLDYF